MKGRLEPWSTLRPRKLGSGCKHPVGSRPSPQTSPFIGSTPFSESSGISITLRDGYTHTQLLCSALSLPAPLSSMSNTPPHPHTATRTDEQARRQGSFLKRVSSALPYRMHVRNRAMDWSQSRPRRRSIRAQQRPIRPNPVNPRFGRWPPRSQRIRSALQ